MRSSTARTGCGRSGFGSLRTGVATACAWAPTATVWTPARAQVELEEQNKAVQAGTWSAPDLTPATGDEAHPTFRSYASSWLEDNMLEWRTSTTSDVKWRLSSHLLPHIGEDRLSTIDIPRVTAVKTALLKESRRIANNIEDGVVERDAHNMPLRPLSNESINKCLALLSRILDDAVERGYLRDNPARRVRRLRHRAPRRPILQPHEVRAMFEAADRLDRRAAGLTDKAIEVAELRATGLSYPKIAKRLSISISTAHYRQARYEQAADPIPFVRVWLRLLCAAGLRIDEACRARRCDVDLIAKRLRVGQAKTDAGVRAVQLTPDTVADIERYLELTAERPAASPLLPTSNGTRYNRTTAGSTIIKPLVAETNVVLAGRKQPALAEGVSAHALRKTFFTFLHEAGAPPRWAPTRADTLIPRRHCGSTPSRCVIANAPNMARPSTTCSTVLATAAPTARHHGPSRELALPSCPAVRRLGPRSIRSAMRAIGTAPTAARSPHVRSVSCR